MEAREANLVGKSNLHHLELSWGLDSEFEPRENVEKIFEALKPHPNIESLMIEGYKGVKFPVWMNNQILSNVVSITLSQCENCLQLPPSWQLPYLRHLTISELIHLEYIDTSFQGDKMMSKFPSLEELYIYQLPRLQRLSRQDGMESFPCLTKLQICQCPELTLPCLPLAKTLVIYGCGEKLLRSILNFRSLTHLYVDSIHDSIYLPHGIVQTLTSLHEMRIIKFRKFKGFPTELVSLSTLKSLHIDLCPDFEAFPEQVLEGLTSLQLLDVRECRKFSTLSEGLQHLSALKCLVLNGCPELVALPDGIRYLSSLRELIISGKPTASYGQRKTTICREMIVSLFSDKESDCCPKLAVLPETLWRVPALQSLSIRCYPELASLPHWLGDLTSLQSLQIFDCPKLSTLPPSIQSLSNLQNLQISQCPELVKQCHKETGEDGYKIVHVPNIDVEA
ncbi:hypothetical protein Pint_35555 [Pistacia integerrima]|uniref:Uncharacterized protein n=1 Tax=Pistacia integerrima TaxID=434235 RepID=A0ACC0Y495_9ROSI|nr:hypothetical protein Pint_35555 [Pistacia integerrima]